MVKQQEEHLSEAIAGLDDALGHLELILMNMRRMKAPEQAVAVAEIARVARDIEEEADRLERLRSFML